MRALLRKKKINYSDIRVLAAIIAGEEASIYVFDPKGDVNWDRNEPRETEDDQHKILFNFGENLIRFKEYELTEFEFIVDFSDTCHVEDYQEVEYCSVQAPSGVMRYVFPREDRSYKFLDFLPIPSFRSRIMKKGLKTLLKWRMFNWVGKPFRVLSNATYRFHDLLQNENYDSHAIFTGTPGYWRKPVIQLSNKGEVTHYVKIAISSQTKYLISKEESNIRRVKALRLNQTIMPKVSSNINEGILVLGALDLQRKKQVNQFEEAHFMSLKEMMIKSMKYQRVAGTAFYAEILDQLNFLRNSEKKIDEKLELQLADLLHSVEQNTYAYTSVAHGDFTPWNTATVNDAMLAFDWEMAVFGAPLLYDMFHFIYQSEIMIKRNGVKGVEKHIQQLFDSDEFADFAGRFDIDLNLNHRLYLLHAISKNLMLFANQEVITEDQKLLIQGWKEMIAKIPVESKIQNARTRFLEDFQKFMYTKEYAIMKFFGYDFKSISRSSDLDLAIEKMDIPAVEDYVMNHPLVKDYRIIKKSYMHMTNARLVDGSYVSIDLIYDFIRKGMRYMDVKTIIHGAENRNELKYASIWSNLDYIHLFYTLNGSSIPLKYQRVILSKFYDFPQRKVYLQHLKMNLGLDFESVVDSFDYTKEKHNDLVKHIKREHRLGSFGWLWKKVNYLGDLLVDFRENKGFMVTFSGVDGAGKTTIVSEIKRKLEVHYRKDVVLLRHRPGILPILSSIKYGSSEKAEEIAGQQMPRQGTNKSGLGSLMRFSYYFVDYLLGQPYIYFNYILRGKIVIYDRYYYDFINDAKRSNIQLNRRFVKGLFALIYKPDYNFYLYNDPDVILSRKQEMSAQDIVTLNSRYAELFTELQEKNKGKYCQIKNDVKSDTLLEIFNSITKVA